MILNPGCPLGNSSVQTGWRTPVVVRRSWTLKSEELSVKTSSQIYSFNLMNEKTLDSSY